MIAMAEPTVDQYYTVDRIKHLLRVYTVLGYSKPPDDPAMRARVRRAVGDASWTEASARAADIERAVRWLNERDWRAAFVVRAVYIVGLSERDAQRYLIRHGVAVHHSTVHQWKRDGLTLMSAYLCGRLPY